MQGKSGLPAKKMIFLFLFACVLWVLVSGYENDEIDDSRDCWFNSLDEDMIDAVPKDHDRRYPYAPLHKNQTGLVVQFQNRHVNKSKSFENVSVFMRRRSRS